MPTPPRRVISREDMRRDIDPETGQSFYRMVDTDDGGQSYEMKCTLCGEHGNVMSRAPFVHAKDCPLAHEFDAPAAPPRRRGWNRLGYFARPFPSRKGFAAYRSPGPMVHFPAWAAMTFLGMALLLPHGWLGWAALVWFVAGLYFGRDLAIYCHYLPLLTLVILAGCVVTWAKADDLFRWGERHSPLLGVVLTLALAALLAVAAVRFARQEER